MSAECEDQDSILNSLEDNYYFINSLSASPTTITPSIYEHIDKVVKKEVAERTQLITVTQNVLLNEYADISIQNKDLFVQLIKNKEEIRQLHRKINNITRINSFRKLEPNWNKNNAGQFTEAVIEKALAFINSNDLKWQPNVFPTGRNSIQLEYEKSNSDYLEIEIYQDFMTLYYELSGVSEDLESITPIQAITKINEFFSRR